MDRVLMERIAGQIRRWRRDPVLFVREMFQAEPTEQQKELLGAVVEPGAKVSVRSGHGTGKTTSQAWIVMWFLVCFEDVKIPCTASSQGQLRDVLWSEVALWHGKMPEWWKSQIVVSGDRVVVRGSEKTRFAVARTAGKDNPDALQGFHAKNILFMIDEASGVFDKVFEVAEGALSTKGARVVMCANPTRLTGYFYESHHKNRDLWRRLHFSCEDSPLANEGDYIKNMEKQYGRDNDVFRVRVLGDFPNAAFNQLIPLDIIEAGQARWRDMVEKPDRFMPKIIGVDVAPYGGDRSAIFFRQGIYSKLLWQNVGDDDVQIAGRVAEYAKEHDADAIFIDQGAGSGVASVLRQSGFQPVLVPFGSKPLDTRYLNKRAEMWGLMRDWLRDGGAIPDSEDLRDDLVGPLYFYSMAGKLQLEKKEDMKKRGLASPDLADALALTFAMPVQSRAELSHGRRENSLADYDPFENM